MPQDPCAVLKQYFGHASFRPGQETLIASLLDGRDALGVMPTGAGKSVCYQVPALMRGGITVVISPLISLMKDQVASLIQAGIPAAYINSSLTAGQQREVFRRAQEGRYKIIYVAPERLTTAEFMRFSEGAALSLIAVDEAHCVSQWGQDFRPSYLKIRDFIAGLPVRPPVGAFTATATGEVKADIVRLLDLHDPLVMTTGFDRENLFFDVLKPKDKFACLLDLVSARADKSGIVYCLTRKNVEAVCAALKDAGIAATRYHAGLDDAERRNNQDDFINDRAPVMVATNAFGMGIDKSNVSYVIHYNMPKNLESYYQEAGRAGRDGAKAECLLLYAPGDVMTCKFLIENTAEDDERDPAERLAVIQNEKKRLSAMVEYCKTADCLRAYILHYFGEAHGGRCDGCGNCRGRFAETDITVAAQKIMSCIACTEKKHPYGMGAALYTRMLCGAKDKRVAQLGLQEIPTYGTLRDMPRETVRDMIDFLTRDGYLFVTSGEYPVLHLNEKAQAVLTGGERVFMRVKEGFSAPASPARKSARAASGEADGLFETLKALRMTIALKERVPPYIIFSNASLQDMAEKAPRTLSRFMQVNGVGTVKAARYADRFIQAIAAYENGQKE